LCLNDFYLWTQTMRVGSEKEGRKERAINCGALKSVWDHGFIVCVCSSEWKEAWRRIK
jgi:hypothetical protein